MEKQEYTQATFNKAYNKLDKNLLDSIKKTCNLESFKTILRSILADTYTTSITNYETMLPKISRDSDDVYYKLCVTIIIFPYQDTDPNDTIKKIIEDLYNPSFSYRQMRIEYEIPRGLALCPMGFVALQMKYLEQGRLEEIERRERLEEERNLAFERRPFEQYLSAEQKEERRQHVDAEHARMIRGNEPVKIDNEGNTEPNPFYTAVFKPSPSRAQGGSRRRRRTAHRKRKSHRKSKRVHHTRGKHTRRHRHSRRH